MATTPAPLLYWKVLKEPANGLKLGGRRHRKLHDVFQATERHARFLVLEGIVAQCDAAGVLTGTGGTGGTGTTGSTGGTTGH